MQKKHSTPSASPEVDHSSQLGMERIVFFSDAVFAIAVTLLALEIRLPAGEELLTDSQLLAQLGGIWHRYLGYFISFMVIGIFWMAHHRKFGLIKRYDSRLIWLNLFLLLVVAFIPFPTSLISEYSGRVPTIFYAATMLVCELLIILIWGYASKNNRLTDPNLDAATRRRQFVAPISTGLVFLLSIVFALFLPDLAKLTWLLILPVSLFATREKK